MASSASSFALNSFYGGSKGTSSKGRDSALSNTEWPPLNSVTTRRKAGRPSVSQNKGKKGRSSVDKENVSFNNSAPTEILSLSLLDQANEDNLQVFNENYYGDLLNKGGEQ